MAEPVTATELAEALRRLSSDASRLCCSPDTRVGASVEHAEELLARYDAQQAEASKPERDESRDIAIWRGLNVGDGRKLNGGPFTVWNWSDREGDPDDWERYVPYSSIASDANKPAPERVNRYEGCGAEYSKEVGYDLHAAILREAPKKFGGAE